MPTFLLLGSTWINLRSLAMVEFGIDTMGVLSSCRVHLAGCAPKDLDEPRAKALLAFLKNSHSQINLNERKSAP